MCHGLQTEGSARGRATELHRSLDAPPHSALYMLESTFRACRRAAPHGCVEGGRSVRRRARARPLLRKLRGARGAPIEAEPDLNGPKNPRAHLSSAGPRRSSYADGAYDSGDSNPVRGLRSSREEKRRCATWSGSQTVLSYLGRVEVPSMMLGLIKVDLSRIYQASKIASLTSHASEQQGSGIQVAQPTLQRAPLRIGYRLLG